MPINPDPLTIFVLTIESWDGADPVVSYHKTKESAEAAALAFAHKWMDGYEVSPIPERTNEAVFAHVYGLPGQYFEYGVYEVEVQA